MVQQVELYVTVLFLRDFTPDCIVRNSLSALATSQDHEHHCHKTTARGGNYLQTVDGLILVTLSFFSACVKGPFLRKLLTGSCFVLCVATSPRDKNTAAAQTPSHLL